MKNILPKFSDRDILQAIKNGDKNSFDCLYHKYADILAYKINRLVKLPDAVQEIHQDVFIKFWSHRERIDSETNLKAYLFTIARNLVFDFYRKASKDQMLKSELISSIDFSYNHIDALIESKEAFEVLDSIIEELPTQRQKVFRLIKIEGKTYEEASQIFNVSTSTIKDHMAKSNVYIKHKIKSQYPELLLKSIISIIFYS
ncbi:RNA polymerase sigma factor [Sphingobacterium composti Ten et al. 2007 non Yoo et al. 2007]|uniref:RNA polymerase sigma factor n=1 Tax=Sphingobacterium composti TaxID=363260 RepID=UPI0013589F30|nr:sigma-70 family RNA polymerase sigma factor [Sphingobacterium composti Ten et al. 2007 non Yoo et al. 2007]